MCLDFWICFISRCSCRYCKFCSRIKNLCNHCKMVFGRWWILVVIVFQMFVYQPTFNTLELKRAKELIMLLVGNLKFYLNLNFFYYMVLFYLTWNISDRYAIQENPFSFRKKQFCNQDCKCLHHLWFRP